MERVHLAACLQQTVLNTQGKPMLGREVAGAAGAGEQFPAQPLVAGKAIIVEDRETKTVPAFRVADLLVNEVQSIQAELFNAAAVVAVKAGMQGGWCQCAGVPMLEGELEEGCEFGPDGLGCCEDQHTISRVFGIVVSAAKWLQRRQRRAVQP